LYNLGQVTKNSAFILAEKAMKMGSYLLAGIVIARSVGAEVFGVYSSLLSLNVILSAIAAVGLNSVLVREYITSKITKSTGTVLTNAFIIRLIASLILALLSVPFAILVVGVDVKLAACSALIIMTSIVAVIDLYFESSLRNYVVARYRIVGYTLGIFLKIYVAVNYDSAYFLILAHLCEMLAILALSLWSLKSDSKKVLQLSRYNGVYAKRLLSLGFPLLLSAVAGIIYMKVDQLFVVYFLGKESAGLYAAPVRLCEGLFIFSAIVVPSFFPNLVNMYANNVEQFHKLMRVMFFSLAGFGILVAVCVVAYSEEIILLVYGKEYISASIVLFWYACSVPLIYIGELFSRWLVISDNTYLSIQRHLVGLIINLLLNYLLIPHFGIEGAAVASFVAYCGSIFLFSILSPRARKFYNFLKVEALNDKTIG
jgi:O-antigen/teichoic acid export membrane protein